MAEEPQTASPSATSQLSSGHDQREDSVKQSQTPASSSLLAYPNGDFQMYPILYPVLVPGLTPVQYEEQMNRGAGIYAVPVNPIWGHVTGLPSNNLIPLTYNIPTTRASNEAGAVGEEQGRGGQQQHGQQQQGQQQQPAPERQVIVRRFQIEIRLDLFLILKLAALIFLFHQDGSKQRLAVLVFFASLIYLYQTGALAPLVRWLSQGMQRAAAPPQPQRPAAMADNGPAAARPLNENGALGEGERNAENEAQPAGNGNQAIVNENGVEPEGRNHGNRWWGIVKEIQMIVFGFITSLLPGFHNVD